jgi:Xaa-Pro aminopeptidase
LTRPCQRILAGIAEQIALAFLKDMGRSVLVVFAAPLSIRNNDVEHDYRQDSDFYYLTGFDEPQSVLVLTSEHHEHRTVIFARKRDKERETWDGPRAGVDGAKELLGADAAYPIEELSELLPEYLSDYAAYYRLAVNPSSITCVRRDRRRVAQGAHRRGGAGRNRRSRATCTRCGCANRARRWPRPRRSAAEAHARAMQVADPVRSSSVKRDHARVPRARRLAASSVGPNTTSPPPPQRSADAVG